MGLFMQRPEHNDEWAGLPSEPLRPRSAAELLGEDAPVDIGLVGLLGEGTATLEIALEPAAPEVDE